MVVIRLKLGICWSYEVGHIYVTNILTVVSFPTRTKKSTQKRAPTLPNWSCQQQPQLQDTNNMKLAPTARKRLRMLDLTPQPSPQGISIESKDQTSNSNTAKKAVSVYKETPKRFKLATNPSIRKQHINRLMNQIMDGKIGDVVINPDINRISSEARQTLHIRTEDRLIQKFQAANECAAHDNRVTVHLKDIKLVQKFSNARRNY